MSTSESSSTLRKVIILVGTEEVDELKERVRRFVQDYIVTDCRGPEYAMKVGMVTSYEVEDYVEPSNKVYVTCGALLSDLEVEWEQPSVREQGLTEFAWPTAYGTFYTAAGAVAATVLELENEFKELYKEDPKEDMPKWYWKTEPWKDMHEPTQGRYQVLKMYETGEESLIGAVVIREMEVKP